MYSHCTSCKTDLGGNEVLEAFPVGRRIAFDPYKGRLWVLCSYCRSWNLAPLHDRWEAVEALEREFEVAQIGASTERVSLGRTRSGLTLVRIGRVDRLEFAGWRFGDRLLSRRRKFSNGNGRRPRNWQRSPTICSSVGTSAAMEGTPEAHRCGRTLVILTPRSAAAPLRHAFQAPAPRAAR